MVNNVLLYKCVKHHIADKLIDAVYGFVQSAHFGIKGYMYEHFLSGEIKTTSCQMNSYCFLDTLSAQCLHVYIQLQK